MNPKWLLTRLVAGHLRNVSFRDISALVASFGFYLARVDGSHHIYRHEAIAEQLNLLGSRW